MTTAPAAVVPRRGAARWTAATLGFTVTPILLLAALARSTHAHPGSAIAVTLFVGSSVHVGSTAWFYLLPEVRAHMRSHLLRYAAVPALLIAGSVAAAVVLDTRALMWVLLAFFAWQFHHFQKQNLGVTALAARAGGTRTPGRVERAALVTAGAGGVLGLLGHPQLLQVAHANRIDWLFVAGLAVFCLAVGIGAFTLFRRPDHERPWAYSLAYSTSLLFFLPVWLFASPYAAVAGLTIAHGLQYLLLMTLLAGHAGDRQSRAFGVLLLVNVATVVGLMLNLMSHLHDGGAVERALFGVYLGLTMTHFVVDAGLWRLREEFSRRFLSERLPFLLGQPLPPGSGEPSPP